MWRNRERFEILAGYVAAAAATASGLLLGFVLSPMPSHGSGFSSLPLPPS